LAHSAQDSARAIRRKLWILNTKLHPLPAKIELIYRQSDEWVNVDTIGGSPGLGNQIGLYDPATPIILGGTGPSQSNFYGYNNGPGVLLGPAAAVGRSALGERFAGDSEVGILIGTLNTPTSSPAPFTPSSPLFSTVITVSSI
jgi:hypothetical protein